MAATGYQGSYLQQHGYTDPVAVSYQGVPRGGKLGDTAHYVSHVAWVFSEAWFHANEHVGDMPIGWLPQGECLWLTPSGTNPIPHKG